MTSRGPQPGEPWHALLAPLPAGVVVRRKPVAPPEILATPDGASIAGWDQLTVDLSAGAAGLRVVLVVIDAAGQVLSASDTVLYSADPLPGSFRQETLGGRFETDGTFRGTRWRTTGVETDDDTPRLESTPSAPTDAEIAGIKALVADVLRRVSA